ncbi:DNA cytosine methyltransferase [Thauera sp.]|uniref:DNA cytosine methyltransferase n=1 Tax=Thauera sp. TaxID=1905334 RepID=UPI0039E68B8F
MTARQLIFDLHDKLIVDLFAGGGGMSVAMEMAWGRSPDIAINHNDDALSMHRINHPQTRHFVADVFEVCPRGATQGRPVGWLHLSPDCTHHSQARGGQPRSARIRALAWVGPRWGGQVLPDNISLENVKQFLKWGPLIAKRCRTTRRVMKLDGSIAAPGERVPVQQQFLIPDPKREGETFRRFVRVLESLGYVADWRLLKAANLGGHTTRERLFMIFSRTGQPIDWEEPTHFQRPGRGQHRWKPAADCIDWSIPCPSIFERARPLAEATLRRIARGIVRYVLESGDPFVVNMAHGGKVEDIRHPISTIATEKGGCRAVVVPTLIQIGYGERAGQAPRSLDIQQPLGVAVAGGIKHALACAYLMQANGGFNTTPGHDLRAPMSTVTNTGSQQQLVTCMLSAEYTEGAERVAAFLMRYYGEGGQWSDLRDPMTTVTTKDRMALVTVTIKGTPWLIVDIGLRMLEPRELFRAQDFPESYIIDRGHDGRRFSKSAQVRMVGNSVNPLMAVGFLRRNAPAMAVRGAA